MRVSNCSDCNDVHLVYFGMRITNAIFRPHGTWGHAAGLTLVKVKDIFMCDLPTNFDLNNVTKLVSEIIRFCNKMHFNH